MLAHLAEHEWLWSRPTRAVDAAEENETEAQQTPKATADEKGEAKENEPTSRAQRVSRKKTPLAHSPLANTDDNRSDGLFFYLSLSNASLVADAILWPQVSAPPLPRTSADVDAVARALRLDYDSDEDAAENCDPIVKYAA